MKSETTTELEFKSKDVGEIQGLIISTNQNDSFYPEKITIKRGNSETTILKFSGDGLNCPQKCTLHLDVQPNVPSIRSTTPPPLSPADLKNLQTLSCSHSMLDSPLQIPSYSSTPNYSLHLVTCPPQCLMPSSIVYGLAVHPDASMICASSIVDKSTNRYKLAIISAFLSVLIYLGMPLVGGVVGIGVFKGLEGYQGGGIVMGLGIRAYDRAKLSYVTFKGSVLTQVDNVDMIDSDIRIIDHRGMLSSFGRVEERVRGVWGTICSKGSN